MHLVSAHLSYAAHRRHELNTELRDDLPFEILQFYTTCTRVAEGHV